MKNGISEIIGSGILAGSGEPAKVYRSLRLLLCSGCACLIREGEFFTRRKLQGINLTPRCRQCSPIELNISEVSKSGLIDALLRPELKPQAVNLDRQKALSEIDKRLGPALARTKKTG